MKEAFIVGAVRTPIGKKNGSLSTFRPDELLGIVLRELVERVGIDPALVEDVVGGTVTQVGELRTETSTSEPSNFTRRNRPSTAQ